MVAKNRPIKEYPEELPNDPLVRGIITAFPHLENTVTDTTTGNPSSDNSLMITKWRSSVLDCIKKAWRDPIIRAKLFCNDPEIVKHTVESESNWNYKFDGEINLRFVEDKAAVWKNDNEGYDENTFSRVTVEIPVPLPPGHTIVDAEKLFREVLAVEHEGAAPPPAGERQPGEFPRKKEDDDFTAQELVRESKAFDQLSNHLTKKLGILGAGGC